MQPASSGPIGLCFNENAARPDQNVEMTGCRFGGAGFFLMRSFTAAFKALSLPELPRQTLSQKTTFLSDFTKKMLPAVQFVMRNECETRL